MAVLRPKWKTVTEADGARTYTLDRTKRVDSESEVTFRDLIGFANEGAKTNARLNSRWLGFVRRKIANMDDLEAASALARVALEDLVSRGTLRRQTNTQIRGELTKVRERRLFDIENNDVSVWLDYDLPTVSSYVAYCIASLISADLADVVCRCKLSECREFFWAPLKRGPRPTYCCESHRKRGSKREERGKNP